MKISCTLLFNSHSDHEFHVLNMCHYKLFAKTAIAYEMKNLMFHSKALIMHVYRN